MEWSDPDDHFEGPVAVLSPHMDDGELGCGGTIARLSDKDRIFFVYVTDGSRSHTPPLKRLSVDPRIGKLRTEEALSATRELGIPGENVHFLGYPEGDLGRHREDFRVRLLELLRALRPASIFAPFRYDRHPDHLIVNQTLRSLLSEHLVDGELFEYFIYYQSRLLPKKDIRAYVDRAYLLGVDIGTVSRQKRAALDCHRSQVTNFYPWQDSPVLSEPILAMFCDGPELFLRAQGAPEGAGVFASARPWIRISHRLEPVLKRNKDRVRLFLHALTLSAN